MIKQSLAEFGDTLISWHAIAKANDYFKSEQVQSEAKAGRMISTANAERLVRSLSAILEIMELAGIDVPGYSQVSQVEPTAEPPAEEGKGQSLPTEQLSTSPVVAGPSGADQSISPTVSELELEIAKLELSLLEV
jgi:hypothetical protein